MCTGTLRFASLSLSVITLILLYSEFMANNMALHWAPPPPGAIKINVHGHTISSPLSNGNSLGIGAIFITSGAEISLLTTSAIPALTPLGNQLWAMYVPLRRAVVQEYDDLRLETDNYEAYMTIKHFHVGVSASIFDIADQLDTLIHDAS